MKMPPAQKKSYNEQVYALYELKADPFPQLFQLLFVIFIGLK